MSRTPPNLPRAEENLPARPANPPRELSAPARRRSWREPGVRFWLLAFVALLVIAAWFFINQTLEYRSEQRLITQGVTVQAIVIDINGNSVPGMNFPPETPLDLKFTLNGKEIQVGGTLNSTKNVTVGQEATIHVNPDSPSEWTDRTEPESLPRRLIAGAVTVPAMIAALLAAFRLRRRAITTWRNGMTEIYSVVDTYHTALAPRSHTVMCVAGSGRDQQIITVYLPSGLPRPKKGELLWLIHMPGKPRQSIPAAAYM